MKTILLTVNCRKSYGEEARAIPAGVYEVENLAEFKKAVEAVTHAVNKGKCVAPSDRPKIFRDLLTVQGFPPISIEEVFAPTI